ncbi:MAG: pirin family protein [Myxococcales bacterium]|nr:pirin family protein [Myxococcales bacterium]
MTERSVRATSSARSGQARTVREVVRGRPASDGAGVRLTRMLGTSALSELDPFLLLDQMRSDEANDYIAGFPNHPHRGFETVTYMIEGRMRHRDNQGNEGLLGPGSVQWMTAGRGIVHSEMPEQEGGTLWGFQLWVNLPASDKMMPPRYQDIPASDVPEVARDGALVRVLAGGVGDVVGPVRGVATEPVLLDVQLSTDATLRVPLPAGHTAFAAVIDGEARIGPADDRRVVRERELAVLSPGDAFEAAAGERPARVLLAAGRPLGEPVARYGPFVMNTREQLVEAFRDYEAGRL